MEPTSSKASRVVTPSSILPQELFLAKVISKGKEINTYGVIDSD
jgi:hypothetical protein